MIKNSCLSVLALVLALIGSLSHASPGETSAPLPKPDPEKQVVNPQVNPSQDIINLKSKIIELQNNSKLGFNKIVPCKSVEGFGVYSPLEPSTPSNKLLFYIEPANYSTLVSGDRYILDCAIELQILDGAGKPVTSTASPMKINRISRSPILDFFFKIELNLKMAKKPEPLLVRIVLHDKIKNQSAGANLKIKLEPGKSKKDEQI